MSAIKDASSGGTVRGVFNFAVSYQDISFDKMTEEKFYQGMAAKVFGSKNLHEATASLPLDFFVMTSSFGTVYAFPTQSTYLTANNFLYYFARYRLWQGLPATTVSLGFISDLGALTQDSVTVNLFVRAKGQTVTGSQVLRMLEPAFVSSNRDSHYDAQRQWLGYSQDPLSRANIITGIDPAVLAVMRLNEAKATKTSSSGSVPRWYHDTCVSHMLRAVDGAWRSHTGEDGARGGRDLENAADKSPAAQLRRQFEMSISKIRGMHEEGDKEERAMTVAFVTVVNVLSTVAEHGVDSLLAAEFRDWLHVAFGKNISMLDLMDARIKKGVIAQRIVDKTLGS